MRVKEEKEKAGFKFNITKKKKILCHLDPSIHGKIDGGKVETMMDTLFLGSKFTVDVDCSYEIKRRLLLGKSYGKPRQLIKKEETSLC